MSDDLEKVDELVVLESIYDEETFVCGVDGEPYVGFFYIDLTNEQATVLCNESAIILRHLTPLTLQFSLPPDYPSASPPSFNLSCLWLNPQQLQVLSKKLDDLWQESSNTVILYTWANFLQTDACRHLNISFPIPVSEDALLKLSEYSSNRKEREFGKSSHECPVCIGVKPGINCVRLDCQHIFCKDCLSSFLRVHISDGSVTSLTCPAEKCTTEVNSAVVRSLVSSLDFERYDRLLLQNSLDSMADVIYCPLPHCQCPVVVDKDELTGICGGCHYTFCIKCQRPYHGADPCRMKSGSCDGDLGATSSIMLLGNPVGDDELKSLIAEYLNGGSELKKVLEQTYGKKAINEVLEYAATDKWIAINSKSCPNCTAKIEKTSGCNKMICSKCKTPFCWRCNSALDPKSPYQHFSSKNSPCYNRLFPMAVDDGVDDDNILI